MSTIDTISSLSQVSNPAISEIEGADRQSLADDFDSFLLLLTTQLQNQDPTEPLDTNEFTNQLVNFAGVEQTIKTNEHLENLINLSQSDKSTELLAYIGRTVDFDSDTISLENGTADFAYELSQNAENAAIIITDPITGETLFNADAENTAGVHRYSWDGIGNDGVDIPDGQYNITISAIDAQGNSITTGSYSSGRVNEVAFIDGQTVLRVGEETFITTENVLSVRE